LAAPGWRESVGMNDEAADTEGSGAAASAAERSRRLLLKQLFAEPQRFEFFQAVRVLAAEMARSSLAAGLPAGPALGSRERGVGRLPPVRFHTTATLGFPQGAITAIRRPDDDSHVDVDIACFGLVGPSGALPRHYTSLVVERYRKFRDSTFKDFLDIFVQRMAALLCRAWLKYRPAVQFERTALLGKGADWDEGAAKPRDPFTAAVAGLVGLGSRGLPGRLTTTDDAVYSYAAHHARQPRSAEALQKMLADLYRVPVTVEQFRGRWLGLEPPDQTMLPDRSRPEGLNARLGIDAIAGRRVWDVESTFEVRLGPLDLDGFRSRMPGTPRLAALGELLRLYAGPQYDIHVRLILAARSVPRARLGGDPANSAASRLGWTTWLNTAASSDDRADAAFIVSDGIPAA